MLRATTNKWKKSTSESFSQSFPQRLPGAAHTLSQQEAGLLTFGNAFCCILFGES